MRMIECTGVKKQYNKTPVLSGISFQVPDHTIAVVLGRSGSGKTTMLRVIAGLDQPDSGTIAIDGQVVDEDGFHEHPSRRGIGMMFQTPALWPHLTLEEHIRYVLDGLSKDEQKKRVDAILTMTDLVALKDRYPSEISGGQARRTALARALAGNPRCLLLDEPLINLDSDLKDSLIPLIREMIHTSGAATVYVTHDRAEALLIGDQFFILENGTITPLLREDLEGMMVRSQNKDSR
ncbi:MAG: ABC transporter ATP-binding protein [Methanoregula sp.]|nr:ABC transporter ATP-binding protein [Methanoregula sp.]